MRSTIQTTMYQGTIQVDCVKGSSKIYIRPDNTLSRMLSNKWLKFLSILLLIYPFIWLFKRFHRNGGGRWEVCGGAYALKRWVPSDQQPPTGVLIGESGSSQVQEPGSSYRLIGLLESEWLINWQRTIVQAVHMRYQSQIPLQTPTEAQLAAIPNTLSLGPVF